MEGEQIMRYITVFELKNPVIDFDEAANYLVEDNMLQYFDHPLAKDIESIVWKLETEDSGIIELITKRKFDEDELLEVSDYVSGQNSDGLGEGFEQQDFAYYPIDEDDEDCDEYVMASFDWATNNYIFEEAE